MMAMVMKMMKPIPISYNYIYYENGVDADRKEGAGGRGKVTMRM